MIIAIDLTSLSWHLSGIERYAMCITDRLIDLDNDNKYVLIFRSEIPTIFGNRIDGIKVRAEVLKGNNKLIFFQFTLEKKLHKIDADKYLFFAFPSPLLFRNRGIINTIHDMGAWDAADEAQTLNKYYFRASYRNAAKVSEKLITVSNFSKERIHEILKVPYEKINVINSGVYRGLFNEKVIPFEDVQAEYKLPDKYILTLSTLEPRKNLKLLLEAFDEIADRVDYDLVLVGRKGWKIDQILEKYCSKKRIHITGFVKDEHISTIYKKALCFVFPSLYEGFGLPPVEALALGIPVISSDAASLPEVLIDQCRYFRNNDKEELMDILVELDSVAEKMPRELNEFQKINYCFDSAAKKVIELIK